ncbi:MAG: VTT domain-containing protein [Patescibacteria group bacterium]|jgi:membrane-associated protein
MELFSGESLTNLVRTAGYLGLFAIIFAESGLFIGFFLPGDSLLFTAGLLASQGILNIYWLILVLFVAAVTGDNVGYTFGRRVGHRIFKREDSLLFHKNNLIRAENFYKQYGSMTIIIARFIPIVRTFAPIVAGVGKMEYKRFFTYNLIGGFLWTIVMTLSGFILVKIFPNIEHNLSLVVLIIIIVSVIQPAYHIIKERSKKS